jgi:hypothetical protein
MKKPKNEDLIELIAQTLIKVLSRLDDIEVSTKNNEEILLFIEEIFKPPKDIIKSEEEIVAFSKELYNQICKYCGKDGINFMGIA